MATPELMKAIDDFDLEGFAIERGGFYVKANEIMVSCPVCGKDKLSINITRRVWHCWHCERPGETFRGKRLTGTGAGGVVDLLAWMQGMSVRAAGDFLLKQTTMRPIPDRIRRMQPQAPPEPPLRWALPIEGPAFAVTIDAAWYRRLPYLQKRGISFADVQTFKIAYCTDGLYAERIVFPVFERGRLVYFQARATWEAEEDAGVRYVKSINPPKSKDNPTTSKDVLMNLDSARQHARVVIVEGPIDCVHAGPSSVCTFGKSISPRQIQKLRVAGVKAVDLMWDGPGPTEPQGTRVQMAAAARQLAPHFNVRLVYLPFGDPGMRPRAELDLLRQQGVPYRRASV